MAADSSDTFQNLTGMYKIVQDGDGEEWYFMWLEYETTFLQSGNYNPNGTIDSATGVAQVNEAGATWCNHSLEQQNETWRLMFQMGDEFSDWEGLKYTFTAGSPLTVGNPTTDSTDFVYLTRTKLSNDRLQTSPELYDVEDGTFRGYFTRGVRGTSTERCVVTILRQTQASEVTTDDGQVVRITKDRVMQGISWDNAGGTSRFEFTLTGEYSRAWHTTLSGLSLALSLLILT